MNHMKQVAEMLGVELGERFALESGGVDTGDFVLGEDGLYSISDDGRAMESNIIVYILTGKLKIVKKPWLPNDNEVYYCIDHQDNRSGDIYVVTYNWQGNTADYMCYATGNCFKTKSEAYAAIPWYEGNIKRIKQGEKWEARN